MEFLNHPDQPMEAKTIYDDCSNAEFAERIQQERHVRKYHVTEAMSELELRYGPKAVLTCLLYTSPSPRDRQKSRMPSSA